MLIIKMKIIMLINKQVRLVFVEGDENASNGMKIYQVRHLSEIVLICR